MLHKPTQRFLPFRTPDRKDTQELAELRIESLVLPKRVESALKLIGDLYLARVHNAATARFYLPDGEAATSRKLDIVANFYQLLTDRVRTAQSQTLELIIIALILAEILMAVFRRVIVNRRVTSAFGGTGGWTSRVTCLATGLAR